MQQQTHTEYSAIKEISRIAKFTKRTKLPRVKLSAIRSTGIALRHNFLTAGGIPRSNESGQRLGLRSREKMVVKLLEERDANANSTEENN